MAHLKKNTRGAVPGLAVHFLQWTLGKAAKATPKR